MTNRWTSCGLLAALLWSGTAPAQVDLSKLDRGMAGPPSQVLVLGSVHLSQMPEGFEAATLQPVLAKLAAFKPDIVTVEAIPGESCAMMKRNPAIYAAQDVATYCSDTTAAKKATGLDVPAAVAAVKESLAHWPAQPHAAQRRHLAALFLASGDDASALTQWLQLPQAERHAGDGLDDALATRLRELQTRNGEDLQIAARLAARLGLQRVYPVDDHSGDNVDVPDVPAYANAIRSAWAASASEVAADRKQQVGKQATYPRQRIEQPQNDRDNDGRKINQRRPWQPAGSFPGVGHGWSPPVGALSVLAVHMPASSVTCAFNSGLWSAA